MADEELERPAGERRPVLTGLVALVAVGLVVGAIVGGGALAATRVLGLGDDGSASAESTAKDSMFLPRPEKTQPEEGPLITLAPGDTEESGSDPSGEESSKEPEVPPISLSAGQTEVTPMGQIDLTGVYPRGEGAILQVQQFTEGAWDDFPVTASVSNETFSTFIQTSQPGRNRFRVIDTDTQVASNEVRVTIS